MAPLTAQTRWQGEAIDAGFAESIAHLMEEPPAPGKPPIMNFLFFDKIILIIDGAYRISILSEFDESPHPISRRAASIRGKQRDGRGLLKSERSQSMKPAELLTVAVSIPFVIGVLAVSPQPGRDARYTPASGVQATVAPPALLEEVVVTAKRTNSFR